MKEEEPTKNTDEYIAAKVSVTFKDGHAEDYDTFILAVATGLTPVGKEGDTIIYIAEEDKFQTRAIAHIGATSVVVAALVKTFFEILYSLISKADPKEAIQLLEAIISLGTLPTVEHEEFRTKNMKSRDN